MHTHGRGVTVHWHQATLNGKGAYSSQDVSAVGRCINPVSAHYNLGKQVVDIGVTAACRPNNGYLAS
jgi:hypothetical protein